MGMAFPLVYFGFCFCTAFARSRSVILGAVGIGAHILLASLVITIGIKASPEGAALFAVPGLLFSGLWFAMYYGLPKPAT
jgi:hypothetical protein